VTVRTNPNHPSSMSESINKRLRPSAGEGAGDEQVTKGTSPSRTVTTVWHGGTARQHPHPADSPAAGRRDDGKRVGPPTGPLDRG
jgi:hypothetical protein